MEKDTGEAKNEGKSTREESGAVIESASPKKNVITNNPCGDVEKAGMPEVSVTEEYSNESSIWKIEQVTGNYSAHVENEILEYPVLVEDIKTEEADVKPVIAGISSNVTLKRKSDSLALISSYDISSDSDDELNTSTFTKPQDPIIIDSDSDSESGSIFNIESDASNEFSSDEESGGDNSSKKKVRGAGGGQARKVMSCLDLGELPPIKDLQISVKEEECLPFGKVHSIVETLVVIESLPYVPALNLDSVLFTKSGEPLGEVFDVFGPVKRPYYTIRFNSPKDIEDKSLSVGAMVYCAPKTKYTQYVFIHQLAKMKGSDASWKNDVEPPAEFIDYSDDEQESRAKKAIREAKLKAKAMKVIDVDAPPVKLPTFEERMNQRNTLRNQMFISNNSPEKQEKDWFRMGASGGGREVSGPSSSGGGLVRRAAFTPQFHSPRPASSYVQQSRPGGFQLTPGGFLAGRGGRFSSPIVNGPHFGQHYHQPMANFGSQSPRPSKYGPPGAGGGFVQGPAFGQPQSPSPSFGQHQAFGQPQVPSFGHPQGPSYGRPGFAFGRQQVQSKPFLTTPPFPATAPFPNTPPFPATQFSPRTPHTFQYGGPIFPSVSPPRPMAANSPPYLPHNNFPRPPNRSSQPNQNSPYPTNMFSNNSPFSQFRHFNQN